VVPQTIGTICPSLWLNPLRGSGTVIVERYRLKDRLSGPDPVLGSLWRAVDVMADDLPVTMRQMESPAVQKRLQAVWPLLQSLRLPSCLAVASFWSWRGRFGLCVIGRTASLRRAATS